MTFDDVICLFITDDDVIPGDKVVSVMLDDVEEMVQFIDVPGFEVSILYLRMK